MDPHLAHEGRPRISFSLVETLHLAAAVVALTFCFAFVRATAGADRIDTLVRNLIPPGDILLASFLAVTTGFVLHELAHKLVAQRYGYWAEFRAGLVGLVIAIGMALVGLLVAVPGATWIQGKVSRQESGLISIAGPAVNFVVAWAAFPFSIAVNPDEPLPLAMGMVAQVNSVLAAFNLLPVNFIGLSLDGRKVLRWKAWVWGVAFAASAATAVFINLRLLGAI